MPKGPIAALAVSLLACTAFSCGGSSNNDQQRRAMNKAISDLRATAQSQDALGARQAANDVSKVIVDVFDLFEHKVPSDIGRLDWQERQVLIDADRGDWNAVAGDLAQLRQTFNRAKPGVLAAGGERQTADFEASLNEQDRLAAAKDPGIVDEAELALAVGVGWNRRQQVVNADALRAGELVKLEERAEADALLVMRQHLFLRDAELVRDGLGHLVRALPVLGPFVGLLLLRGQRFI